MARTLLTLLGLFLTCWPCYQAANGQETKEKKAFDVATFVDRLRQPATPGSFQEQHHFQAREKSEREVLAFSADQTHLALGGADNDPLIIVWDVKSGKRVSADKLSANGPVSHLVLSTDGKRCLVARSNWDALLLEVASGKTIKTFTGFDEPVVCAHLTHDGKFAMFVERNGRISRHPLDSQASLRSIDAPEPNTTGAAISPSGKYIVLRSETNLQVVELLEDGSTRPTAHLTKQNFWHQLAINEQHFSFIIDGTSLAVLENEFGEASTLVLPWQPRWLGMSVDSQRQVLANGEGSVQVIQKRRPQTVALPEPITALGVAPDGYAVAYATAQGKVVVGRLPEFAESTIQVLYDELKRLVMERDFVSLEAIFTHFERDPKPFLFKENKTPYQALIELVLLYPSDPAEAIKYRQALSAWATAQPDSTAVRMLRGTRHIQLAWRARGTGFANTVTREGWQTFADNIEKAREALSPLVEKELVPAPVYNVLFEVAKAQSWSNEKCEPVIDALMKQSPLQFEAHYVMAHKLMERWGGAPHELAAYAARAADNVGGAEGDGIYARIAWSLTCFFPVTSTFSATGLDYDRTIRGCEHLGKTADDGKQALVMAMWYAKFNDKPADFARLRKLLSTAEIAQSWPDQLSHLKAQPELLDQQITLPNRRPGSRPLGPPFRND